MDVHEAGRVSQVKPGASARERVGPALGVSSGSGPYRLCQLFGWSTVGLLNFLYSRMYPAGRIGAFAAISVWSILTGIGLSHAWRQLLTRRGWLAPARRTPWARMLAGVLALASMQTALVTLAYLALQPAGPVKDFGWLPNALISWTVPFFVWTALYASISSLRRARRLESDALRLQVLAKDAELRVLKAQVNPHFFFNSLNSLRALVYQNPDAAARMIDQLAGSMRYALRADSEATVPLGSELVAVNAYLAIEKIRFEERLRSHISIASELEAVAIPPMALQTLVENAVKYGVERSVTGSEIRISARRDGTRVQIEVKNLGELAALSDSLQLGLDNTRKRLQLLIGPDATLEVTPQEGWVVATLTLPGNP